MRTASLEVACVRQFATRMKKKLRENRFKGGWRDESLAFLLDKLNEEVQELADALSSYSPADMEDVFDEAADVGNMAMMIADVVRHGVCLNDKDA